MNNHLLLFFSFPLLSSYSFSIAWSNALILQLSSLPIQSSQLFIKSGDLSYAIESLGQGMLCSFLFLGLQLSEMLYSLYSLSSVMIGSSFYLTTGLHGLHVLIGSLVFYLIYFIVYSVPQRYSSHYVITVIATPRPLNHILINIILLSSL